MKSITQIKTEATKLYEKLEFGSFSDTYHDLMYDLVNELNYLVDDEDGLKSAKDNFKKCKAIIEAQKLLLNVNLK